jgi:hypothetical protein
MARNKALSTRATRVLHAIATHGPMVKALDRHLVAIAGSGRGLYDALVLLNTRMLIRWDKGGTNLRVTKSGRELLASSHYRRMLAGLDSGRS